MFLWVFVSVGRGESPLHALIKCADDPAAQTAEIVAPLRIGCIVRCASRCFDEASAASQDADPACCIRCRDRCLADERGDGIVGATAKADGAIMFAACALVVLAGGLFTWGRELWTFDRQRKKL